MDGPKMIRAKGDGVTIRLAEWPGAGAPILGVHGLTANCRSFDSLAAGLVSAHRFLALDLRGRGLSDKPESGYSIDHHCRDIEAVLADQDIAKVSLMGHSLGAYISLVFAATRPHLVDRLVLLDGGADLSVEQWIKVSAGIKPSLDRLGRVFAPFDDYMDRIKQAPFMQPWNEVVEAYFRYESERVDGGIRSRIKPEHIDEERANLVGMKMKPYCHQVTCPVLVLRATKGMLADDDLVLPEQATADLIQSLPTAELVNLAGVNHFSLMFQPNRQRDMAILEFMSA